ncbi:MAG: hypothetical protein CO170_00065 [candidate division SR1 bacterium CG_4_9_14_3_um_filter_40_9]|nr:MAG: hypothetical protein CO170_00065 [candidate division SR1 bacterium CG_4_9_14_3_um_filter_40_9]
MAVKKTPIKKVAFNKAKVNNFKKVVKAEARVIGKEGKEFGHKVGTRRETSNTEEKVYTILGILLLIFGLYVLRQMIGGMILIVIGILFVTGFFMRKKGK